MRPHLKDVKPYSSARDEYTGTVGVFLDANENPHGSAAGTEWNRYPDPYQRDLKREISKIKHVAEKCIFLGNGSDEPIDLLIRAFCEPGKDHILTFPPTYGMYQVSAGIQGVGVEEVLLKSDFQLDLEAVLQALTKRTENYISVLTQQPNRKSAAKKGCGTGTFKSKRYRSNRRGVHRFCGSRFVESAT